MHVLAGAFIVFACSWCDEVRAAGTARAFEVDDYFDVVRVVELEVAPDGRRLLYVMEQASLAENVKVRSVHVVRLDDAGRPSADRELSALCDARQLRWRSSEEIAFLADRSGRTDLFAYDLAQDSVRALAEAHDPIISYKIAPNASDVAYTTLAPSRHEPGLHERIRESTQAVTVDAETTDLADLLTSTSSVTADSPRLWLSTPSHDIRELEIPGDVLEFFWSADAALLSVTYVSATEPPSIFRSNRTSLGIYERATGRFRAIAPSPATLPNGVRIHFSGGEWLPKSHKVAIRRITEKHSWLRDWAFPELAVFNVSDLRFQQSSDWRETELYLKDTRVFPQSDSHILIATRAAGVDSLLAIENGHLRRTAIDSVFRGSKSLFSFSADFRTSAFVGESFGRLPDIYVHKQGARLEALGLNRSLAERKLPDWREFRWSSTDGTAVRGWLIVPPGYTNKEPLPLLTYVHGGPLYAFPNGFAPFFNGWPYPLEVLALQGIAVFVPNYRGTLSYGRKMAFPDSADGQPVDDIVSGVRALERAGIADSARLAIAGHSHGGWLGPMVATRYRKFVAGSFAEGWSNHLMLYESFSNQTNREIHEAGLEEPSMDDDPERYLELSPDLHLRGLRTAFLFEAGSEFPIQMMGMHKAAARNGLQTAFFIYPQTTHILDKPRLQRESAIRNLRWLSMHLLRTGDSGTRSGFP